MNAISLTRGHSSVRAFFARMMWWRNHEQNEYAIGVNKHTLKLLKKHFLNKRVTVKFYRIGVTDSYLDPYGPNGINVNSIEIIKVNGTKFIKVCMTSNVCIMVVPRSLTPDDFESQEITANTHKVVRTVHIQKIHTHKT